MLVAVQLSVLGLYLPPVLKKFPGVPAAPDDHFTAGPHSRVQISCIGRVGGAGGCPTIGTGVVFPAGIRDVVATEKTVTSAPDDHFTAGPHCRVIDSASRRIGRAGPCPTIRSASGRRIRYCGKRVVAFGTLRLLVCTFARKSSSEGARDSAMGKSRSTSVGLARHSAITKGSFPSATNSSRRTSGCFVSLAIRSISACNCSAPMALCQ